LIWRSKELRERSPNRALKSLVPEINLKGLVVTGMAADFTEAVAIGASTVLVHSVKMSSLGSPRKQRAVAVVIEFEITSETVCVRVTGGRVAVRVVGFKTDADVIVLNVTGPTVLRVADVLATLQSIISRYFKSKETLDLQK
jgi:hypothetical protein